MLADQQDRALQKVLASNGIRKKEDNQSNSAPQKQNGTKAKETFLAYRCVCYIHRFGRYTCVLVPKNTSADSMTVSDNVG